MTITFSLSENDLLQNLLIAASKNATSKKKRTRSWIIISFSFLILGLSLLTNSDPTLGYYFLFISILSFLFYPTYQRRFYIKHYKKFVNDNFKSIIGESNTVTFESDFIESNSKIGSSKINLEAIEVIYETGKYFFIKLNNAQSFIIPKEQVDAELLRNELTRIANSLKIEFTSDLNWQWK